MADDAIALAAFFQQAEPVCAVLIALSEFVVAGQISDSLHSAL
jgi:hypothetical protein